MSLLVRKCFCCDSELFFVTYMLSREPFFSDEERIKFWNNINIEFFCCGCYYWIVKVENVKITPFYYNDTNLFKIINMDDINDYSLILKPILDSFLKSRKMFNEGETIYC